VLLDEGGEAKMTRALFLVALAAVGGGAQAAPKPPAVYVDKGACPGECCSYGRDWAVAEETKLYDRPEGRKAIGRLAKGEKARAVTGEVHTRPNRLEVSFDHGDYAMGDVLYVLTHVEKQKYKVWRDGKVAVEDLFGIAGETDPLELGSCEIPSHACWGEISQRRHPSTWWVKLRTATGAEGWTKETRNLKDRCEPKEGSAG
jgi:hypothetical protein